MLLLLLVLPAVGVDTLVTFFFLDGTTVPAATATAFLLFYGRKYRKYFPSRLLHGGLGRALGGSGLPRPWCTTIGPPCDGGGGCWHPFFLSSTGETRGRRRRGRGQGYHSSGGGGATASWGRLGEIRAWRWGRRGGRGPLLCGRWGWAPPCAARGHPTQSSGQLLSFVVVVVVVFFFFFVDMDAAILCIHAFVLSFVIAVLSAVDRRTAPPLHTTAAGRTEGRGET